jgi:hypothetical protein
MSGTYSAPYGDQYDKIVDVLALLDQKHPKLSAWERDQFLTSLSEKHDQYGSNIKLSGKQLDIVKRIHSKCYGTSQ